MSSGRAPMRAGGAARASRLLVAVAAALVMLAPVSAAGPTYVDITWMSISNVFYEIGSRGVLTDGYFTRIPQSAFYGGRGGLANTHAAYKPDVALVSGVLDAIGGPSKVNLLLTGHSHFDHSFDTATWSSLTKAPIIGSQTTCFQARAEGLPASRCRAVVGGEKIAIADGVTMYVVRWNHSGDSATNPEQHSAVELTAVPTKDPATGGLHAGVAEDFPNGGGNRAFLFVVDAPGGRFSWFFNNSASAVDLAVPIVVGGKNYGAPIENLKAAMKTAGLTSVDLWIGSGGLAVARLVEPVLKPKTFLPVHWDGLWSPFRSDVPSPYRDPTLTRFLDEAGVTVVTPLRYMDKWRLDRTGIKPIPNDDVKRALGFKTTTFFDDFAAPEIDRTKWNVIVTGRTVNNEQQAYVDSKDTIYTVTGAAAEGATNGALAIHPRFRQGFMTPEGRAFDFVSGRLESRGKMEFTYGTAAARIKLSAGSGLWPAFWALGTGRWPDTGEMDIMENVGERDWTNVALHGPGYSGNTPLVMRRPFPAANDTTGWHEYSMDWTPDTLVFKVDQNEFYRATKAMVEKYGKWAYDNPKYLIVNMALGGQYPRGVNKVDAPYSGLPQATVDLIKSDKARMLVDWIRVTGQ